MAAWFVQNQFASSHRRYPVDGALGHHATPAAVGGRALDLGTGRSSGTVAVRPAPGFDVAAWVAASCEAQGVPVKVTDPDSLRRVCALLGASESGPRPGCQTGRAPTRQGSESPERPNPLRVEGPGAGDAGFDDGMVEHGPDDGSLAVQAQVGPLSA